MITEELKQDLYAKIGRNVVLFQHLELLLKHLIARSEVTTGTPELNARQQKREKEIFRKTLGQLAGDYVDTILEPVDDEREFSKEPKNLTEPWIRTTFRFGDSEKFQAEMREHMADLVTQRNDLIHTLLPRMNLKSEEKCKELCAQLDTQAETVRNSIKHFQSVGKGMMEYMQNLVALLLSEEGRKALFPED